MSSVELEFAMLALAADVTSSGKLHVFGASFDTLEVGQLPTLVPPFALVVKLSAQEVTQPEEHVLRILGVRKDGEIAVLVDSLPMTFSPSTNPEQLVTYAATIIQVGLNVTRTGKFQFVIEVDGNELKKLPLWIVETGNKTPDT